jgi:hypothetical protein
MTIGTESHPPHQVNAGIPAWFSFIVMRAMAPDPADRYRSAGEMAEALRVGRRSGEFLADPPVPVEQIREDDPTPRMVKIETDAVAQPWHQRAGQRRHSRRGSRSSGSYWLLFFGLVGAVSVYFLLIPVKLSLRNNLLVPVEMSTSGGAAWTLPPGGEFSLRVPQQGRMIARWFVVQPAPADAGSWRPETMSGMIRIDGLTAAELLFRRVRRSIDSWSDGSVIYAPRVSNATAQPVRVQVTRLRSSALCNCLVGPGETRLLGYFRLESSSAIQISGAGGRSVVFRNLESRIDLNTGLLALNVNDTILSRPPR